MGWLMPEDVGGSHAVTLPGARSLARADAANLAHILLGEPDVAIRPDRDTLRPALGSGGEEPGDKEACRGDAPDEVAILLGEPKVAIRPARDGMRRAGKKFPT